MSILEGLAELLWPTRCVICDVPGDLLCHDCRLNLPLIDQSQACPSCGIPYGALQCIECHGEERLANPFAFAAAFSVYDMTPMSRKLVTTYKDGGERRMGEILAQLLAQQIPEKWLKWAHCCTYVPADKAALRRRGFDHMEQVAQAFARDGEISCKPFLEKLGGADQRALGRAGRAHNMEQAFALAPPYSARTSCQEISSFGSLAHQPQCKLPQNILLLDDVMTSGATLNAAAGVLLGGGAGEVRVATVLRAW